jgi:hypothetical protein
MSRLSIIIFFFSYAKISRKEKFFQKILENFQPPPPRIKKFPAAAAEKDIGLHL